MTDKRHIFLFFLLLSNVSYCQRGPEVSSIQNGIVTSVEGSGDSAPWDGNGDDPTRSVPIDLGVLWLGAGGVVLAFRKFRKNLSCQ